MRIVLEAFPIRHSVHVPARLFGPDVDVNMKVRALIVSELIPLPLCDSTIPRWHTHGVDREIHRGNIHFQSDDFKERIFCFLWEYKPAQWRSQWYQLFHPRQDKYLAHPLKGLCSRMLGDLSPFVAFLPERT